MENASKALIIAGAILISIVLIGVGVLIVGNAQGIFDTGSQQLSQLQVTTFNSKFTSYEGKRSGSQVRALVSEISAHNGTAPDGQKVNFNGTEVTAENLNEIRTKNVSLGKSYNVSFEYDKNTQLITNVKAEEIGSK